MTKLGFESLIPILFPSVTLLGISMLTDTQCLHFAEKGYVIYERGTFQITRKCQERYALTFLHQYRPLMGTDGTFAP
jgi:hypothetical protein